MRARTFLVALVLLVLLASCHRGPPKRLVPAGAEVVRELPRREEQCYVHRTWVLHADAPAVERWAKSNDVPCVDTATPCTRWSTEKRGPNALLWFGGDEPNGLDSVDATLAAGEVTIDWGDYTCSGPN